MLLLIAPKNARRLDQAGLSLIELMVALAISLFMIIGVSSVYVASKQLFKEQDNLARMQESGRLAMEYLSRDIREAGYFGCASKIMTSAASGATNGCSNTTDAKLFCSLGGTGCADFDFDPSHSIYGYEATTKTEGEAVSDIWSPALPDSIKDLVLPKSDVLTIRSSASLGITIDRDPPGAAAANIGVNSISGITASDILVATDCKNAAIFQACTITSSGADDKKPVIVHDTGNNGGCASSYGNSCKNWGNNYKGGSIAKAVFNTYFIAKDAANNNIPTLYKNDIKGASTPLVPNIYNLQITYGVAPTMDDYPTSYKSAKDVTDWSLVKSVRIELLIGSPETNLTTTKQVYYFNGSSSTATDSRLYLPISTTVSIRNRTLQSSK